MLLEQATESIEQQNLSCSSFVLSEIPSSELSWSTQALKSINFMYLLWPPPPLIPINHFSSDNLLALIKMIQLLCHFHFQLHMNPYPAKIALILSLLFLVSLTTETDKLIVVQQIFRHGARYPLFDIKDEQIMNKMSSKSQLGQLTRQGKHMHYVLGKMLYKKYWKRLFAGTEYERKYHSSLFQVWSSNVNRTIESAQAQLIGLLQELEPEKLTEQQKQYSVPPYKEGVQLQRTNQSGFYVFREKNQHFHTIPIHTEPVLEQAGPKARFLNRLYKFGDNFLLTYSPAYCPAQDTWIKQNKQTKEYRDISQSKTLSRLFRRISEELGYKVDYFNYAEAVIDNVDVAKHLDVPYLKVFADSDNVRIANYAKYSAALLSFHTEEQRRNVFTPFLQKIVSNFKGGISNVPTRFFLFSAHDTGVLNVISALEMVSLKCLTADFLSNRTNSENCISEFPPFAASVLIQLWQRSSDKSYYIKILYNGKDRRIPVCGGKVECPSEEFQRWARGFQEEKYWRNCGLPEVVVER